MAKVRLPGVTEDRIVVCLEADRSSVESLRRSSVLRIGAVGDTVRPEMLEGLNRPLVTVTDVGRRYALGAVVQDE
jgi:hypothetical protein